MKQAGTYSESRSLSVIGLLLGVFVVQDNGNRADGTVAKNPEERESRDEDVTYARSLVTLGRAADCHPCVGVLLRPACVTHGARRLKRPG